MLHADRIRMSRLAAHLSQRALGEKIGKDQAYISRLERGEFAGITVETLEALADALDSSADYLLGRSDAGDDFWAVRAYLAEQEGSLGVEETIRRLQALTAQKDTEAC